MKCGYFYDLFVKKFKLWGGNADWIDDPKCNLPEKLKRVRFFVLTMIVKPYELIHEDQNDFDVIFFFQFVCLVEIVDNFFGNFGEILFFFIFGIFC